VNEALNAALAEAQPVTCEVPLCFRGDLNAARQRAERDLQKAIETDFLTNEPDQAPAVAARIKELEEEQAAASVIFLCSAVGRPDWERVARENPATEDEIAAGAERFGDGWHRAIIKACVTVGGEKLDDVDVAHLLTKCSDYQFAELIGGVIGVNAGSPDLPKSAAATAVLRSSVPRSTTADPEESLGLSS
jgi:hypothetical protein